MTPFKSELKGPLMKMTLVAGLFTLALLLIWMNRFQYEHSGARLVRLNRFTGQGCYFLGNGTWDSRGFSELGSKETAQNRFLDSAVDDKAGQKTNKKDPSIIDAIKESSDASVMFGDESKNNQCK